MSEWLNWIELKYLQRTLRCKLFTKLGGDDICETKGSISSKKWPLVKNEKSSVMKTWKVTFTSSSSWSESDMSNSGYCEKGSECESGNHGECYQLFQSFFFIFFFFCKKHRNTSGYELGLDQTVWNQILALHFFIFVTLCKLLNLSVLLFPIWKIRTVISAALGLLWGFNLHI